jgi:hypothetical protein
LISDPTERANVQAGAGADVVGAGVGVAGAGVEVDDVVVALGVAGLRAPFWEESHATIARRLQVRTIGAVLIRTAAKWTTAAARSQCTSHLQRRSRSPGCSRRSRGSYPFQTRKLDRLEENLGSASVQLTDADLAEINEAAPRIRVEGALPVLDDVRRGADRGC